MTRHPREYITWKRINQRCHNPNHDKFAYYGARGIEVCQRWRNSFAAFIEDMGAKPSPLHSIERIKNNGNYEPENCRWATQKEQARNTRRNHFVDLDGKAICIGELAEQAPVGMKVMWARLKAGWSPADAISIRDGRIEHRDCQKNAASGAPKEPANA